MGVRRAQGPMGERPGPSRALRGSALPYRRKTKCALLLHLKHASGHGPSHIRAQESGGVREWAENGVGWVGGEEIEICGRDRD